MCALPLTFMSQIVADRGDEMYYLEINKEWANPFLCTCVGASMSGFWAQKYVYQKWSKETCFFANFTFPPLKIVWSWVVVAEGGGWGGGTHAKKKNILIQAWLSPRSLLSPLSSHSPNDG